MIHSIILLYNIAYLLNNLINREGVEEEAMKPMYSADINSDMVILEENISSSATSIKVNNVSLLPSAPNLATIGFDDSNPETILYEGIDTANNRLINVKRGFQGTAQSWEAGAKIARVFTAYDHDTFKENIEKLNSSKINKSGDTITGNLLPAPGAKVNLGSPDRPFSSIYADDLYLSAHSLYINDKKVIEDISGTIQISTDPNQSLNIITTGVGNLSFLSEDEINLVADGGIEATVSGSKSTKHINFTNDSPGGNLTFYANGSGGQIQFSAKDAITFNGSSVKIDGKNVWHEGNFNPASKSDTNHTHDNRYYTESEINNLLSNKSDINHTHSQYLTELPSGEPRTNLGNPTITEMALFDSQFDNKLWFYPPDMFTFEYTNDGTTWVVHNVSESNIKKLVSGYVNASISIPNSCKKYRIRIQNKNSYVYINALYAYISTDENRTAVRIRKKREDGDWIQHTNSSTTVSCWSGHLYLPMERIAWSRYTTSGHYRYIEIEFEPVWSNENNISLQRLELWGGYPAGSRSIFSWDENKNVKFPADIYANGNTKVSLEGHTHDDRYYTESEIDSKLSNKADKNHTHSQYLTSSDAMLKSIYDINNNGVVDRAEKVDWTGVENAPTEFNPAPHNHDTRYYSKNEVDNKLTNYSLKDHTHSGYNDKSLYKNNYIDIEVGGDADTYYPVLFNMPIDYMWGRLNISRHYYWPAPDTWHTETHKGGLTLEIRWSGDSSWGGNNKNIVVEEFRENYCNMVGGLKLTTSGLLVWLRGGGARYRVRSDAGTDTCVEVYLSNFTDLKGDVYSPRTSPQTSEITQRLVWNGTNQPKISVQSTEPTNPSNGDIWIQI